MSEQDEAEIELDKKLGYDGNDEAGSYGRAWPKKVERALVKLSAEVAALREQIATGREWRSQRERSAAQWLRWLIWQSARHLAIDLIILALVLLWLRKRRDRRLEDLVRAAFRLGREYVRRVLPAR